MKINGSGKPNGNLPVKVLLIDDDPAETNLLKRMLSRAQGDYSYSIESQKHSARGLDTPSRDNADLVFLDLSLPNRNSLDTLVKLKAKMPTVPIIVITKGDNEQLGIKAIQKGAQDYLLKSEVGSRTLTVKMRDAIERKHAEKVLQGTKDRLEECDKVLVQLAKSKSISTGNVDKALEEITKTAAHMLDVERVGIWLFDENHKTIRCAVRYEKTLQTHGKGDLVDATKYPTYFEALENSRYVAVRDVREDERTHEFLDIGLPRFGATSMLDAPVRLGGRTIGILCHWHLDDARDWSLEERNFVGVVADLVALVFEANSRRQADERLNHLVHYDALTDLPNRLLFSERLNDAILTTRQKQTLIAVLYVGLDHFKRINDTLGHNGGDEMLVAVSKRLSQTIRSPDLIARIGSDTFAVLLSSIWKTEDAIKVVDRVSNALKTPFLVGSHEFFLTCSIGISFYPADGRDAISVFKNADTAMFRAKQKGRNNYQLFSPTMNAKALERLVLENSLRRALERDEFRVHYQPVVDLATGAVTGMEALVRWQHPNLGFIVPNEFIPLAEETGLIVPIGEWVLRTACTQTKAWQAQGYAPMCVSVNLSARQFQRADLAKMVQTVLKETGLGAKYLELELTESMIMQNAEQSVAMLRELSRMGVKLSIDDFGTGYSSLNYLKRFPIRTLKIDRSFIRDVTQDQDDAAIVKAIISMAHSLKLEVVGEGVETQEQFEFLRENFCDRMQGFIFSRPIPPDQFEKLIFHKHQPSD